MHTKPCACDRKARGPCVRPVRPVPVLCHYAPIQSSSHSDICAEYVSMRACVRSCAGKLCVREALCGMLQVGSYPSMQAVRETPSPGRYPGIPVYTLPELEVTAVGSRGRARTGKSYHGLMLCIRCTGWGFFFPSKWRMMGVRGLSPRTRLENRGRRLQGARRS